MSHVNDNMHSLNEFIVQSFGPHTPLTPPFAAFLLASHRSYSSVVPSFFLALLGGVNGPFHSAVTASLRCTSCPHTLMCCFTWEDALPSAVPVWLLGKLP